MDKLHVVVVSIRNGQELCRSLMIDRCYILRPTFFFISVKIDPPDDQNQDIFFRGLNCNKFFIFLEK